MTAERIKTVYRANKYIQIYTDGVPKPYDLAGSNRSPRQGRFAEHVPLLLWRLGNPSKLDCARLRSQLGMVGQNYKRGFAASGRTYGNVNPFANWAR